MKRAALALIVALFAAACLGQQPGRTQKPAAGPYQVSGKIINATTGQPLAGANVILEAQADAARRQPNRPLRAIQRFDDNPAVLSGPDGSFAFTGLRAGKYTLTADKRGFSLQTYQQHEQFTSAIVLGPDKDPGEILFRLEPDASLTGRVVDEHNEPVANAQVMLFREGMQNGHRGIYRAQMANTSDEGIYKMSHIRAGKFYVAVSGAPWYSQYGAYGRRMAFPMQGGVFVRGGPAPNPGDNTNSELDVAFPLTFYPGVTDSASAEALDLKPGQRETADFTLTATPALHVRVTTPVNSEERQFVGATVMQQVFDSTDIGGARARSISTGQGVTEISGLTPGHYLLQIHVNGQNRGQSPEMVRELDITGDTEVNAADTPSGVNVLGTVRFDGPPPSDTIRLVLRRRTFVAPIQLQVSAKGEITSSAPVPPDTYDLALPMPAYQITSISAQGAKLTGQSLQIGNTDVHLNLVAARVSGRVEGVALKDGKRLSGAMIVLVPSDMDRPLLYRRDETDSDGSFTLPAVAPGKYTLIALENGWNLEWSKPEVLKPYLAGGETIDVALDGRYDVKVNAQ